MARSLSLPAHKVIGLPALSPTMTQGNIASYVAKEGDELTTGDRLAVRTPEIFPSERVHTSRAPIVLDISSVDAAVCVRRYLDNGLVHHFL